MSHQAVAILITVCLVVGAAIGAWLGYREGAHEVVHGVNRALDYLHADIWANRDVPRSAHAHALGYVVEQYNKLHRDVYEILEHVERAGVSTSSEDPVDAVRALADFHLRLKAEAAGTLTQKEEEDK